ncbi:hypothetical protein GJ744_000946 [Endocarpon pusillum]|uniref:Uncharacterized protein n=1 Tax=Endocarpon pusillum TaxID=364733 RepID=A0A8H7AHS8_9EURO|nr:hypothetical protein GJ744_000946 [Endocarpon pusillum]
MSSQETVYRIHNILNIVERVTKIDVTSEEGRASAMAILTSEHQHNTHLLLAKSSNFSQSHLTQTSITACQMIEWAFIS